MRAARYHLEEHGWLAVEDVPAPVPGPGQVRLKVAFSGICGSDLARYRQLPHPPESLRRLLGKISPIPGHEFSGVIEALGAGVPDRWEDGSPVVGTRAVVHPTTACGQCPSCRAGYFVGCDHPETIGLIGLRYNGGMAEFVNAPFDHIVRVTHDQMDLDLAALTEPVAVALHAINLAKLDDPHTPVAIIGDGAIGIFIAHLLHQRGHTQTRLIGRHPDRLALARQMGVGETCLTDEVGPELFASAQLVFHTAGTQAALELGWRLLRQNGAVICLGYLHDPDPGIHADLFYDLIRRQKAVKGCVGHYHHEFSEALQLLSRGAINARPIISATIPLEKIVEEGFEPLISPTPPPGKILVGLG